MLFTKSISYPRTFDVSSGRTILDDQATSINRCLATILLTGKGELLGDPDFGCTLYEQLFEQYSDNLSSTIKSEIVKAVQKYETRVTVNESDINIDLSEDATDINSFHISIRYMIKNSGRIGETEIISEDGEIRVQ